MMNKARQRAAPLVIEDKAAALNAIHQGAGAGAGGGGGGGGEGMGIDTDEALNLLLAAWRMHRQQQVETRVGEKEKSAAAQRQRHRLTVGLGGGACAACMARPRHSACSRHAFDFGPARPQLWEPVHPSVHLPSLPLPYHPPGHPPALSLCRARTQVEMLTQRFHESDKNGDGVLSIAEFWDCMQVLPPPSHVTCLCLSL